MSKENAMSTHPFLQRLSAAPLLADGAMGTMLYAQGASSEQCLEYLVLAVKPRTRSGRESNRSSTCWATSLGKVSESRTSDMISLRKIGGAFDTKAAEEDGQQHQGERGRRQ